MAKLISFLTILATLTLIPTDYASEISALPTLISHSTALRPTSCLSLLRLLEAQIFKNDNFPLALV
jgi:hypothetical protein